MHPVKFSLHYQAHFGQHLALMPSFADWKQPLLLKWHPGDIWSAVLTVPTVFTYKYVVLDASLGVVKWEEGLDRIFNFELLASPELREEWAHFQVVFQNYFPTQDGFTMRINGGAAQLGNWNKGGPVSMQIGEPCKWITGTCVEPWTLKCRFAQSGFPQRLVYKYSISNGATHIWEREPSRYLELLNPEEYTDSHSNIWKNTDKGYLVNGVVVK